MFEYMEKKLKGNNEVNFEDDMKSSLSILQKALNPPIDMLVTETRISLEESQNDIKVWSQNNKEKIIKEQQLFQDILERFHQISSRIQKIIS
jgi:hypothetical protein